MTINIIFSGYSINNAQRVNSIVNIAKEIGMESIVTGVVKNPNHNITNTPTYIKSHGNATGIKKYFLVFINLIKVFLFLQKQKPNSINYAINPIAGLIALMLKKLKKQEYIYDSQEMFFGVNHNGLNKTLKKLNNYLEKIIIENSMKSIFSDEFRIKITKRYYKLNSNNLEYIYNSSQSDTHNKSELKEELNITNKCILSYCGGVSVARKVDIIVEAYFQSKIDDSVLYIVGNTDKDAEIKIKEIIKKYQGENSVKIIGEVDNTLLKKYMEISDITFAFYNSDSLNNRYCSPNKIFDSIALKTYIIASACPLVKKILKKYGIGETIKNLEVSTLSKELKQYFENKIDKKFDLANKEIGWESQKDKLKKIILDSIDKIKR
jgi:glycosyltransferase involved in cell wall biosynthesis